MKVAIKMTFTKQNGIHSLTETCSHSVILSASQDLSSLLQNMLLYISYGGVGEKLEEMAMQTRRT